MYVCMPIYTCILAVCTYIHMYVHCMIEVLPLHVYVHVMHMTLHCTCLHNRSPHASDASRKSVTPRKVKELKSLSDFFGSTPIRRTEKQRAESKASATRPPITCVPESPPKSICVDSSTGQQLVRK